MSQTVFSQGVLLLLPSRSEKRVYERQVVDYVGQYWVSL